MTKTKTVPPKAKSKSKSAAPQNAAPAAASTPAAAYPLGFDSLFGFLAFATLCFLVLIAPYMFSGFWPSSYEYWPQSIFLALTAIACVLVALEPRTSNLPVSISSRLLGLFLGWCALSVIGTVYLHDSLLELARIAGVLAWFFLARALLSSRQYFAPRAFWLLSFVLIGALFICAPAIFDFFRTRNPRQFGTFYNPNLFANYCALCLPLAAAGVLALYRKAKRAEIPFEPNTAAILGLVVFAIVALGLVFTSSKGGFLATLCALVVFAIAVSKAQAARVKETLRARRAVVAVAGVVLVLGVGVAFTQMILPRLSTSLENDHSTMFRFYTWKGTWKMAAARPILGFGPGSFPSAYTQFADTGYTRTAHQSWLQIAAESGWPATLLLLAACGASTLSGIRMLQTENWIYAAGALGAVTAFFVHGLTDAGWSISSIGVLLMIVLALLEGSRCEVRAAGEENSRPVPQTSNINWFWLLAALPLALGSWIYQRAQTGEDLRAESRELMARGAPGTALEKAQEAVNTDRSSSRLWTNLAQAKEALGRNAGSDYMLAMIRQPSRAINYLNLAEYDVKRGGSNINRWFESAIQFDPNDTEIRFARGKWKLDNKDQSGWRDIEYIAALKDKPYGKYPATPEMVDLNFARAFAMLAERDFQNKKTDAVKNWIARGLEVIEEARKWELQRRQLEQATYGSIDYSREKTMDELEAQLKALQEKTR